MLKTISRLMLLALLIGGLVTSVATAKKDHEHKVLINHKESFQSRLALCSHFLGCYVW